jgi:DNA (cytosine-5)-methyltransferase 1
LRVSFAKFYPDTYSWKIPHFLFQGDWNTYSQTWPRYGMMVRGECYQLPPWARDTGATVFGELSGDRIEGEGNARMFGTSPCRNAPRSDRFRREVMNLGELVDEENARQASAWPTPTAKGNGNRTEYGGKSGDGLDTAVKRAGAESAPGPTPTVNDSHGVSQGQTPRDILSHAVEKGETKSHIYPTVCTKTMGGCSGSFAKLKELEEIGRLTPEERRAMSSHLTGGKDPDTANCGMLNPDWVEWLMGWPIGWTDIDDGGELLWLELDDDPAEWEPPLMHRITRKKKHRVKRIETLGNGQVPLCAAVAFAFGFEIVRVAIEGRSAA